MRGNADGPARSIAAATPRNSAAAPPVSWADYLDGATLFDCAVRLRPLIWTLQRLVQPGSRLLEAGCGSGTTAVLLADLGYHVVALDYEADLVARIQERYSDWLRAGRMEVVQGDMCRLPWPGRQFDLAYHQGVLEHFPDEKIVAALREQGRVAHRILFDVPNHRYGAQPFGDERLLPLRHWKRLIRDAGLHLEAVLGRDYHTPLYVLPHALFSRRALHRFPWFSRNFAVSSIFICRPSSEPAGQAAPRAGSRSG
jgi:SAM-dependent methyltransferase